MIPLVETNETLQILRTKLTTPLLQHASLLLATIAREVSRLRIATSTPQTHNSSLIADSILIRIHMSTSAINCNVLISYATSLEAVQALIVTQELGSASQ